MGDINNRDIDVSVCVITYNQEKFIARCLQSLVDQDIDRRYEIIVADDASTDSTRNIVEEFSKKYRNLIKPIFNSSNKGAVKNLFDAYQAASGKYIAHMDGDDYAYPEKLRKQFSMLENNDDCVICSHDVVLVDSEDGVVRSSFQFHEKVKNDIFDLLECLPFFAHSSKMFRNIFNNAFWGGFDKNAIDVEVHVKQVKYGKIYHINETLGAYRVSAGVSSKGDEGVNPILQQGANRIFENLLESGELDSEFVKKCYAMSKFRHAYQSACRGDKVTAIELIRQSMEIYKFSLLQEVFFQLAKWPAVLVTLCKWRARLRGYNKP